MSSKTFLVFKKIYFIFTNPLAFSPIWYIIILWILYTIEFLKIL